METSNPKLSDAKKIRPRGGLAWVNASLSNDTRCTGPLPDLQSLTIWLQNHQYANKPYHDKSESSRTVSRSAFPLSQATHTLNETNSALSGRRSPRPCARNSTRSLRSRPTARCRPRRSKYGRACSHPAVPRATRSARASCWASRAAACAVRGYDPRHEGRLPRAVCGVRGAACAEDLCTRAVAVRRVCRDFSAPAIISLPLSSSDRPFTGAHPTARLINEQVITYKSFFLLHSHSPNAYLMPYRNVS